ncbi:MAG TPA: hypothetical protein VFM63_15380 [Pyrinomonadaceae bacterium]|nr:hypothetical protein [Pyrinomonadaceae bacterium]
MSTSDPHSSTNELSLTPSDIYLAAEEGVLLRSDAERLVQWGLERRSNRSEPSQLPVEQPKGFNLVTVAYYFGAMLMITACAWFLGDKWDVLGSVGILVTVVVYMAIATGLGWWLRKKGYIVGGSLLITVAVCLVPLLTYSIQEILGFWPGDRPGHYENYFPVDGSWIAIELTTIAAAAVAIRYVRFAFLTAPIAFWFWFLAMDLAALITVKSYLDWDTRRWITVAVGLCILVVGFVLERLFQKPGERRSEDFAFWCYLFGMFAFWGGLTFMDSDSELMRALYALLNVGFILLAIKLRRTTFLVFGALGVHLYLAHLAYRVFEDSFFFPFALAFLGLSLILLTVWMQRRVLARNTSVENQFSGRYDHSIFK